MSADLADLFARLDEILVEESPMHPFGCATWEEASRIAIDMAKDALSAQSAELAKAREALVLAEDVLSRSPMSTTHWSTKDGMIHPNAGIEIIRQALGETK